MLKVRVIPQLLLQDGLLKKPVQFKNPRTVANAMSIASVFEERRVDELILLDIGCARYEETINTEIVREISEELFVPFSCGGGIRSLEAISEIISAGAEKVVLNTGAVQTPELVRKAADRFGKQCVIVSIDALRKEDGRYEVHTENGSKPTGLDPVEWARDAEKLGAGEILINSIGHEGMMQGYDIDLVRVIAANVDIPVIAAGGAGKPEHFVEAVKKGGASAVAAGSIYHYTRITPDMVKEAMDQAGIPVRRVQ